MEQELARLEKLNELQLYAVLEALEEEKVPQHIKRIIANKIRQCLNAKIGM